MSLILCLSTTTASAQSTAPPLASRPAPRGPPWALRPEGRPEGHHPTPTSQTALPTWTDGRQQKRPWSNYWEVSPVSLIYWRTTLKTGSASSSQRLISHARLKVTLMWLSRKQSTWCPKKRHKCSRLLPVFQNNLSILAEDQLDSSAMWRTRCSAIGHDGAGLICVCGGSREVKKKKTCCLIFLFLFSRWTLSYCECTLWFLRGNLSRS